MSVALLTTPRQACLDRLAAGDPAARAELVRLSRGRLLEMARRLLDRHPRFRRWGESEDLLQDALVRLDRALAAVPLATTADFLAVAATNIRWALSDLVRRYYGRYGVGANHASPPPDRDGPPPDPADPRPGGSGAPAEYAELLELIGRLPPDERTAADLCWCWGLSRDEAAARLGVSGKTVYRRLMAARVRLGLKLGMSAPG